MTSRNTLPITEARKKIFELAEKVQKPKTVFFLTQNGRAKAVIMSADEFDAMEETIEIMSDPVLMEEIREADDDIKKKRWHKFTPWEQVEKELGWNKLPKNKKRVSRRTKKLGKKRSVQGGSQV